MVRPVGWNFFGRACITLFAKVVQDCSAWLKNPLRLSCHRSLRPFARGDLVITLKIILELPTRNRHVAVVALK